MTTAVSPDYESADAAAAGFDPHSDQAWAWAFADLDEARRLRKDDGFECGAVEAIEWHLTGFVADVGVAWSRNAFTPTQAAAWIEALGVGRSDYQDVYWWRALVVDIDLSAGWHAAGFYSNEAKVWGQIDVTRPDQAAYIRDSNTYDDTDDRICWCTANGWTADQVIAHHATTGEWPPTGCIVEGATDSDGVVGVAPSSSSA